MTLMRKEGSPLLEMTSGPVAPLLTLVGAIVFLAGLTFLLPAQPKVIPKNGFDHLEARIRRLLQSRSSYASLIIATPKGDRAILLTRELPPRVQAELVTLRVSSSVKPSDGLEEPIRRYFAERGVSPCEDRLTGNGGVDEATRSLAYPLVSDASVIAQMCREMFVGVFRADDSQGLLFHD